MNRARPLGQQPVARHGVEHARLAQQHDQHHRGQSEDGAQFTRNRAQITPVASIPSATGSETFRCRVRNNSGQQARHQDVKTVQMTSEPKDADRHVFLRISCFLRRRGNRVESDVRKKDDAGATRNSRPSVLSERPGNVGRNEGVPVGADKGRMLQCEQAGDGDEHEHDDDFDENDRGIEVGRFLDADHQQKGHADDGQKRHQVEQAGLVAAGYWD